MVHVCIFSPADEIKHTLGEPLYLLHVGLFVHPPPSISCMRRCTNRPLMPSSDMNADMKLGGPPPVFAAIEHQNNPENQMPEKTFRFGMHDLSSESLMHARGL